MVAYSHTTPSGFEEVHVLGIDPGTTTGFAHTVTSRPLDPTDRKGWRPDWVPSFMEAGEWENPHQMLAWISDWEAWSVHASAPLLVGVEAFIAGSNQRHGRGQKSLQDPLAIIAALTDRLNTLRRTGREVFVVSRSASTVKRWGTDCRLEMAWPYSIKEQVRGPHARDALRHNLYAACTVGYSRDPLAPVR